MLVPRCDLCAPRFGERVDTTLRLGLKSALASGVFAGGASGAFTLSFVAIIYYGGSLVLAGELSSGVLTSFLLYSLTIAGALAGLAVRERPRARAGWPLVQTS